MAKQTAMDTLAAASKILDTSEVVPKTTEGQAKVSPAKADWKSIAALKRQEVLEAISSEYLIPEDKLPPKDQRKVDDFYKTSGFFSGEEVAITSATATEIVSKIIDKRWTAEQVTRAYCKSAAVAHQLTNCLTFSRFGAAIDEAKALDLEYSQTGKTRGPLHGVPVSLKDNINVAGAASTVGFIAWAKAVENEDGYLPKLLKSLGGIIYVKTNVPTAMMMAETTNHLFGTTTNPLNRNLTPGGSSGGESALIAAHGSPLGVGTDIGGSVRIPAACTGLYTIRSSGNRLPMLDFRPGMAGQKTILSVQGPLARSLDDVILYMKSVIDTSPWNADPELSPIPWRADLLEAGAAQKKLKIGVIWSDGYVNLTPPVTRALKETVQKLKDKGHEIVDWDNRPIMKAYALLVRLFTVDGGKSIKAQIEAGGEPWPKGIASFAQAEEVGVYDLWQMQNEKVAIWREWLDALVAAKVDCLLLATAPYIAARHGSQNHIGYTGLFNFLDYSAATFPCGVVGNREKDVYPKDLGEPLNPLDKLTRDEYEAEEIHGLPVGLQLVGRRNEEEKVLGMVKRVLEDIKA